MRRSSPTPPRVYVSPQIENVLGFTVDEYYESPSRWRRQLHPEDREAVIEKLAQALKDDIPFRTEYRIYRKDGSLAWARDEAVVVRDGDDKPLFLQGIMLDVTIEKRLTEELLNSRKLESVGMLAGGIAHDFNNSLMGILGNLSLAKSRVGEGHERSPPVTRGREGGATRQGSNPAIVDVLEGRRSRSTLDVDGRRDSRHGAVRAQRLQRVR